MVRHAVFTVVVAVACSIMSARPAAADVLAVPDTIRHLTGVQEELHALRSPEGDPLGEQRFHAVIKNDTLIFDIATRFTSGEEWDEHGELDVTQGFRSRAFHKIARRSGKVVEEQQVDFTTGKVSWLVDGVRAERSLTFSPDTYIGPMLGIVLATVPEKSPAASSFQALVFRPEPNLYTLRAEAIEREDFKTGTRVAPTTKIRVKADLGPLQNAVFARLIPTHYFWFTRESPPEFLAFEGALGNGTEVLMVPDAPPTKTARAQ